MNPFKRIISQIRKVPESVLSFKKSKQIPPAIVGPLGLDSSIEDLNNTPDIKMPKEVPFGELPVDAFGSEEIATRLIDIVHKISAPYSISISGSWGVGKTTLIDQMNHKMIKSDPELMLININLWKENVENIRRKIVIEIGTVLKVGTNSLRENTKEAKIERNKTAKALDERLYATNISETTGINLAFLENWKRIFSTIAALIVGVLVFYSIYQWPSSSKDLLQALLIALVPAILTFVLGNGLFFNTISQAKSMPPASEQVKLSDEFEEYAVSYGGSNERIVIILDNIDRLSKNDATSVLQEIRSFLDIPHSRCIFIVPIDRELFIGTQDNIDPDEIRRIRDYLNKIFNLDILLINPETIDLTDWTAGKIEYCLGARDDLRNNASVIASVANKSPRMVMRIISAIAAKCILLNENNPSPSILQQIVFIESLVTCFPEVVKPLSRNPKLLSDAWSDFSHAKTDSDRFGSISKVRPNRESADQISTELLTLFSMCAPMILSLDDVRRILSIRQDRQWLGVALSSEIKTSLAIGSPSMLNENLESLSEDQRSQVFNRIIENIKIYCQNKEYIRAFNGLNAITPLLDRASKEERTFLWISVSGLILDNSINPWIFIALKPETISFICQGFETATILSNRIISLATGFIQEYEEKYQYHSLSLGSAIAVLVLGSKIMNENHLKSIQGVLATAPEEIIIELFNHDNAQTLIEGAVVKHEFDLMIDWVFKEEANEGTANIDIMALLKRLSLIQEYGFMLPRVSALKFINTVSETIFNKASVKRLFEFVKVLLKYKPNKLIDDIALALSAHQVTSGEELIFALNLASEEVRIKIEAAIGVWVENGEWESISELVISNPNIVFSGGNESIEAHLVKRWLNEKNLIVLEFIIENYDDAFYTLVDETINSFDKDIPITVLRLEQLVNIIKKNSRIDVVKYLIDGLADFIVKFCGVKTQSVSNENLSSVNYTVRQIGPVLKDVSSIVELNGYMAKFYEAIIQAVSTSGQKMKDLKPLSDYLQENGLDTDRKIENAINEDKPS
jgi:Cdc6-like AAA superfamily ATPase